MNEKAALKKVNVAKLNIFTLKNTTFFSALLANLKIVFSDRYPTAATDGLTIYLNPEFIEPLNTSQLIGLLLHELMHVVYDHMNRAVATKLNTVIWNVAGDYLINGELDKLGYQLPPKGLIDHQYDNLGTKAIYDILIQDAEEKDFEGVMLDLEFDIPEDMTEQERNESILTNVVKAVTQAKLDNDFSSIPGHIARRVEEIINPILPWHVILQNYMSSYKKEDYTWSRPNRRYLPDMYLPSMRSASLDQITVAIDVSGSISQQDLDAFIAEIRYIFDILTPKVLRILAFDTEIRNDNTYTEGDTVDNLEFTGGGGTYITPIIEKIIDDAPEIAIICSDGEFSMPYLKGITTDLFWIIKGNINNFKPSKGTVIEFND